MRSGDDLGGISAGRRTCSFGAITGRPRFGRRRTSLGHVTRRWLLPVIHQILHNEPPDPRRLTANASPHLASLALRLMAKRPEDRFDSAGDALAALGSGTRVLSVERRRRLRKQILASGLGVLTLVTGVLFVWPYSLRPAEISEVRVDPELPHRVQAQYGDHTDWRLFYEFHRDAKLQEAVLVKDGGQGRQIVVVGSARPLDDRGSTLAAFDHAKHVIWHRTLRAMTWIRASPNSSGTDDCTNPASSSGSGSAQSVPSALCERAGPNDPYALNQPLVLDGHPCEAATIPPVGPSGPGVSADDVPSDDAPRDGAPPCRSAPGPRACCSSE